jgi:hypothetical protein
MLWPDELPRATVLSLSCTDELVPCELVQRQVADAVTTPGSSSLNGAALRVVVSPGRHGVLVLKPSVQDTVIAEYQATLRATGML